MDLNLLKEERLKKGYSQQFMANQLGFKDRSSYCHIEHGKVSITIELAQEISRILNFSETQKISVFF